MRILVLGGGGSVGIAWEEGILAGLLDAGLDVRNADLIIGTSAGSVVGTHLRHGRDPRDLYRDIFEPPKHPVAERPAVDPAIARQVFETWSSFDRMTPQACAEHLLPAVKSWFFPLDRTADVFSWDSI